MAVIALTAFFVAAWHLPMRESIEHLIEWAQANPRISWAAFILAYAIAAVCMVPGSLLTMAAGILFGPALGLALVSVASTLGAACAFLVGRFLVRDWVESRLVSMPRLRALDGAVARKGGLIVLLARLSVLIPYNLLNYALGLTRVRFGPYLLSTLAGMLPASFLYVYLGSVAGSLASLGGAGAPEIPQSALVAGFIVTVSLIVAIARLTARALRNELDRERRTP